jgi:hypothetical protein
MGRKMGRAWSAGLGNVKKTIGGIGKTLTRHIKTMATLGGAVGTGALVKDAVELQTLYRDISFLVERVPGQIMRWKDVQELAEKSAKRTGQTTMGMAKAFRAVYAATGDLQFSKEVLDNIGLAATAAGRDTEQIAIIAHMVRRKWGATGDTMNEMMARFIEKLERGGMSMEDLTSRFDLVAGEAEAAGMKGAAGVSQLFGVIERLDARMGAGMGARGFKTLLQYMKNGTTQMERFEKTGKIKFEPDATPFEKIRKILEDPKMRALTMKVFTETAGTAIEEFQEPFIEAYETAIKEKKSEKEATKAGLAAYDAMIDKIGESSYTWDKLTATAEKRVKEDPSVKMREAMNKVRDAFSQPKMIEALGKLADKLPALADAIAEMVEFVVDNPMLALGVVGGLKFGLPSMMKGGPWGAPGAGVAGAEISGLGTQAGIAGSGISNLGGQARGAANTIKGGFIPSADSLVENMGTLIMNFAGAAAMAYSLGKAMEHLIDKAGDERQARLDKTRATISSTRAEVRVAAKKGDVEEFKARQESIDTLGKEGKSLSSWLKKRGAFETTLDQFSHSLSAGMKGVYDIGTVVPTEAMDVRKRLKIIGEERAKHIEWIKEDTKKTRETIEKLWRGEDQAATSAEKLATALDKAAKSAGGVGETGGTPGKPGEASTTRGPGKKLESKPGTGPQAG